ncbi:NAD(+) synthase [Candidatus Roizmanbacteria bacterium]|nr:NAD(+) synthase [Candidatus Roizmanbacteria bacterium]
MPLPVGSMRVEAGNIRVGIAQIRTEPRRIRPNTDKIIATLGQAKEQGLDLVVFPELTIPGYLSKDAFLDRSYIEQNKEALQRIVSSTAGNKGMTVIVGFVDEDLSRLGRDSEYMRYNSAAVIQNGEIVGVVNKTHIPNYGPFDEGRYFSSPLPEQGEVFNIAGKQVGIQICEDLWQEKPDVTAELTKKGSEIIVNLSASPFSIDWDQERAKRLEEKSKPGVTVIYANAVGGQEHIVFDGQSMVYSNGALVKKGKAFEEQFIVYDAAIDNQKIVETRMSEEEQIYRASLLGIKDYFGRVQEETGIKKAVIGLSGGIDSAVAAALTVKALGKENVIGIAMPSQNSSPDSIVDAKQLADNLGIEFRVIPINEIYNAHLAIYSNPSDLTKQNLQARARGTILMGHSKEEKALVI